MSRPRTRLHSLRGTCAALLLGVGGGVAPLALMWAITVVGWLLFETPQFDRQYDVAWLQDRMIGPVICCATLFACAAWATYAPATPFHFATTLTILVALSLPCWFVLGHLNLTPHRLKGLHHPEFYPSELLILLGPPTCAAVGLGMHRARSPQPQQPFVVDPDSL